MKTKFKSIADFLSVEPEQYNTNTETLNKEVEPLESLGKGYQTFQEIEICYSKRITLTDTLIRNSKDAHTILRAIFDPVKLSVREDFFSYKGITRFAREPKMGECQPNDLLLRRLVHFSFYSLEVLRTSDF